MRCGNRIENRFSKFSLLLSGERWERAGRSVCVSFLLDEVALTLWDEDSPGGEVYTRNIVLQGCAESAEEFLLLRRCADFVSIDACS